VIDLLSKLPCIGTTIFSVMTRLAEQHGATNLAQGFPDFDPPPRLIELVAEELLAGRNQYAPTIGVAALREAIAEKLAQHYQVRANPETEITVTDGATEAIFCAIQAVVRSGDEVIVFDPAYDSYEPAVSLASGRTVHLPLIEPEFRIDWERLARSVGPKTRLVIINSPHNPSGALLQHEDLERLAGALRHTDALVISDEVYEHIVFDGQRHISVLNHAELRERAFVISSFGKTYHATGWKVGYCIAPGTLSAELRRVHQFVTFATVAPIQYALARFVRDCPEHHQALPAFYQVKRDYFLAALDATPFHFVPAAGTYFQLADYSRISDDDDRSFAEWLTREFGVATIPISVFAEQPLAGRYVRFCFAKQAATIDTAAERLSRLA
jgi:methionine aminotransferase